jgi:hypothetical protein
VVSYRPPFLGSGGTGIFDRSKFYVSRRAASGFDDDIRGGRALLRGERSDGRKYQETRKQQYNFFHFYTYACRPVPPAMSSPMFSAALGLKQIKNDSPSEKSAER